MKRRWSLLWVVFVLSLVAIEFGIVTRAIVFDPVTSFYGVILAIAAIGVLSIIGAVFVGMYITTRILGSREFTPFEKDMLAMRGEVKALTARVEELLAGQDPRKKD